MSKILVGRSHEIGPRQDAIRTGVHERHIARPNRRVGEQIVVDHPPRDVRHHVRVAIEQRFQNADMRIRVDDRKLARQPEMHPDNPVVGVKAENLLDPWQIARRIGVVAEVRMNGQGNPAFAQHSHERRPFADRLQRNRLMVVAEQRLLHQIDLAHPPENAGKLLVEKLHAGNHRLRLRQVGEGHRKRKMDRIRLLDHGVHGVDEIVLQRRRHRRADTVEIIRAGRNPPAASGRCRRRWRRAPLCPQDSRSPPRTAAPGRRRGENANASPPARSGVPSSGRGTPRSRRATSPASATPRPSPAHRRTPRARTERPRPRLRLFSCFATSFSLPVLRRSVDPHTHNALAPCAPRHETKSVRYPSSRRRKPRPTI